MRYALEEKIGAPELFSGRQQELAELLAWTAKIKRKLSPSRVLLARRKMGKTALLQRLYNLVFEADDGVIPFFFEVREKKIWAQDFCEDFFLSFILQYIAFKSRNPEYVNWKNANLDAALRAALDEGQEHLTDWIINFQNRLLKGSSYQGWEAARDAPRLIAESRDERVLQIIEEFQYLNRKIYADQELTRLENDFAQPYMVTAEYKNAPLLVSGSWVGLLMHDVLKMPGRFKMMFLRNMPREEALEMVYKYALLEEIPVTEESAGLIADLGEGSPFYISEMLRSRCPDRDLITADGVRRTLEFETLAPDGGIKGAWMEYVLHAFATVNDRHAKSIVLYLCKHRDREVGRAELREKLGLEMSEAELERKLDALAKADIIEPCTSAFYYRGVQDNIFDKVFRGRYADEIEAFDPSEITRDYQAEIERLKKRQRELTGQANYYKGMYAEFMIVRHLTCHAHQDNSRFLSLLHNLPRDFQFTEYQSVWSYKAAPLRKRDVQVDILARARPGAYSLVGEVKNRERDAFTASELDAFLDKVRMLGELEDVDPAVPFVFCRAGFTAEAVEAMRERGVAWSEDMAWLEGKDEG